jgi:hypothetical protein
MARKIDGIQIVDKNRFSAFVKPRDKEGMAALASWLDWFKRNQISSVIVLTDKGFALYREGMIDIFEDVE